MWPFGGRNLETSPATYKKTNYANPGAMNYAFVPNMTLPAFDIGGFGNITHGQMNICTGTSFYSNITVPESGYGGLVAGQMVQQGLVQ